MISVDVVWFVRTPHVVATAIDAQQLTLQPCS